MLSTLALWSIMLLICSHSSLSGRSRSSSANQGETETIRGLSIFQVVGVTYSLTSANFNCIYIWFWRHLEGLILHIISLKKNKPGCGLIPKTSLGRSRPALEFVPLNVCHLRFYTNTPTELCLGVCLGDTHVEP